jgi:ABC-type branched-subunit amino acid transport system substrate-binding protein
MQATTVERPIKVGVITDQTGPLSFMGIANANVARMVIDDINAHGGAAGRKLVPVWATYDAQSQETGANQDQAVCATMTQDHHVAAAIGIGMTDNLLSCVLKSGAIDVASSNIDPDNAYFRQFPYYFQVGTLSQDRMMAQLVRSLQRQNYFNGWDATTGQASATAPKAKVGVIGYDLPEWARPTQRVLLPALKAAGYAVAPADVRLVYTPNSTAEDGRTLTEMQNAALQFRQDGVTHVILLDTGGQFLTFFGKDAKSQHYYPRYGLESGSGMQGIYDAGLTDADQLNGAMGFSWEPSIDLSASAADKYQTASTKHCLKVMKDRTGQTFDSTNAASIALTYCDSIYLFAKAADAAGSVINHDTLRSAIEHLGYGFAPSLVPESFFSPSRHDGVEDGWDEMWDSSCTCTKYTTSAYRIP